MTDLTDHDHNRAAHCPHMTGEVCTICQRLHELEEAIAAGFCEVVGCPVCGRAMVCRMDDRSGRCMRCLVNDVSEVLDVVFS